MSLNVSTDVVYVSFSFFLGGGSVSGVLVIKLIILKMVENTELFFNAPGMSW